MQRRQKHWQEMAMTPRNISAHAEKTVGRKISEESQKETSLRMQRRLIQSLPGNCYIRNISAHAEKTTTAFASPSLWGNISAHAEKTILLVVIRL